MKNIYTVACALLALPFAGTAQTLQQQTEGLAPMPAALTFIGNAIDPGPSGENVTWNMASLVASTSASATFTAPTSPSHPDATVEEYWSVDWMIWYRFYHQLTDDALLLWGDGQYVGSDPEQTMAFPCSHGTTWTDAFAFEVPGWVTIAGTVQGEADGYGTLTMPYGVVENVLRVKLTETYTWTEGGGAPTEMIGTQYLYYRPGLRVPVLAIRNDMAVANIMDQQGGSKWVSGPIAMGLDVPAALEAAQVTLAPNPASADTWVRFDATSATVLELTDATGRTVLARRINATGPTLHNERIDLSGLAPGAYCLTLRDSSGRHVVRKLAVE